MRLIHPGAARIAAIEDHLEDHRIEPDSKEDVALDTGQSKHRILQPRE
ncbi:hypothetical protein [Novosphingobium sp. Chol11]|nr:hypothetical protein [Novosphingobium sp. Chol11]